MSDSTSPRDPVDLAVALLASVHHAFFILGHGRRALCASSGFYELSGYTAEEFLALPSTRVVNEPHDTPNASRALNQALAGEPPSRRSRSLVRHDGSLTPVESSAKLLPVHGSSPLLLIEFWPRDGRLYPEHQPSRDGIASSVRDMARDIEPSDLLDGLLASLSHACFAIGQRRSMPLVSDALYDLSGYDREGLERVSAVAEFPLAPPETHAGIRRALQAVLAGGPPNRARRELLSATGAVVDVADSVSLMPVDGGSPLILIEFWPFSGAPWLSEGDAA